MGTILILANSSGGLYDFRNELLEELLKQNRVVVSIPDTVKSKELAEEGCEIVSTPINRRGMNPVEDVGLFLAYGKLLKQLKPDLVLSYTIKPNVYGGLACRQRKIPYLSTITGLGSTFQREGILKKIIIVMYRIGLKKAECVFFQNKNNMGIFKECAISGKKSTLVSGSGVNLEKHSYEEYPRTDTIRLLFVGRIMKEKGIDELLEAARQLHSGSVVFQILGYCDEDYQETLKQCEKDGIIQYEGFQTDVNRYLREASVLVLPTYHEGMSNVLMEASATGRPVIATNISGCKEVFEEGVTGFGCEPRNADSLIAAIEKFLALDVEERAEMGRQARRKMEREFDRKQVTDVYIKEINKVLSTKK